MDKAVEALLRAYKRLQGSDELTPDEVKKFNNVSARRLNDQLTDLLPGEVPIIENIDIETGNVLYQASYGRRTEPIRNLGYRLDDGIYEECPSLSQRVQGISPPHHREGAHLRS